jgi:hypothetical protein
LRILCPALLLLTASPVRGASPTLQRQPAIARDEARRLIPEEEVAEPSPDRLELAPGEQRQRLSDLRQRLSPALRSEALLSVRALEGYLDYDEEDQIVYGPGRTRITYRDFVLEADRVLLDSRLQEIQAEGNVDLTVRGNTIHARSMRYNFDESEGVAYDVEGEYAPVYFRTRPDGHEQTAPENGNGGPQFQMVSRHEALFRDTDITSCNFKAPHYFVRGREVILYPKDRVFFRGATFYAMGVPVFYLPVYSRSLQESSPWFVFLGYGSRSGTRVRLGYSYEHRTKEPSLEEDDTLETRSRGTADLYADYISKFGPGLGFDYDYAFEYNKHKGELSIYGLSNDEDREVFRATPSMDNPDDTEHETDRWRALWLHRSQIAEDLTLLINVDEFSDPDIFYDVLDLFGDERRHREVERRSRVALTFLREAYVVRLMADVKDRIGLDRLNDYSDPRDNNRDFDLDPYNPLDDNEPDGIGNDRWGRVSSKLPQLDAATRWLPSRKGPLYYRAELHLYNALDKGLNTVDTRDDAYVQGVEFYQQIMRRWRLSRRYTLLAKAGLGFGGADRDDEFGLNTGRNGVAPDGTAIADDMYPRVIDGLTFVKHDTFLTGRRRRSLDDLNRAYLWGDAELRLDARFSDALRGWLRWRLRETTDDFIGDWYASIGGRTVREDLYNYRLREHWIEGGLNYALLRPLLTLYTAFGANLESGGDVYPQEPLGYFHVGGRWANRRQTLVASAAVATTRRQIYDPSDPRAFKEIEWGLNQSISYSPIHQRWYLMVRNRVDLTDQGGAERSGDKKLTFFTDEDANGGINVIYGRELGPKWDTEIEANYDYTLGDVDSLKWVLQRDLHDAIAVLEIRAERDDERADSRDDDSETQLDFRTGIKFKLPGQEVAFGPADVRTVRQAARQPAVAE